MESPQVGKSKDRRVTEMRDWIFGVNSGDFPTSIADQQFQWGVNVVHRGGLIQTRPGLTLVASPPNNNPQGITLFTDQFGSTSLVYAVGGRIYALAFPFYGVTPTLLPITFDPDADAVFFCTAVKAVKRNADGTKTAVPAYPVLMIQDGVTRAAYWDGAIARHLAPGKPDFETPILKFMVWTGAYLWGAIGANIRVSDVGDPFSFYDGTFLAEADNFQITDTCTGMLLSPDLSKVFCFSSSDTTSFIGNILDRTTWLNTLDFQQVILPATGCVSGLSPINKNGKSWWFSQDGVVNFDAATQSNITGAILTKDQEMSRSKTNLSLTLGGICAGEYENYLFFSVPDGDLRNSATWAMDSLSSQRTNTPTWCGVWNGFRPVQWASGQVNGQRRCFCLSANYSSFDGSYNAILEAFSADRRDNGGPISCQSETKLIEPTAAFRKIKYAELDLIEIYDQVAVQVSYAGIKGGYTKILDTTLQAEHGSINSIIQPTIEVNDTVIQEFRPQCRTIRTQEVSDAAAVTGSACGIESPYLNNIDKAFSLLIEWQGRCAIRAIRVVDEDEREFAVGACEAAETGHQIVTFQGQGISYP